METAGRKVGRAFQTKERGIGAMLPDDEVITKVSKAGIPAGTFGVVESIDEDRIWVDVFNTMRLLENSTAWTYGQDDRWCYWRNQV